MTDKQLAAIEPCPFCGGAVEIEQTTSSYSEMYGRRPLWGVVCRNTINRGGTCAIQQIPSASEEAALERWNRRAAPAAPTEGVTIKRWGHCSVCGHSTIPGEACGVEACPERDCAPTEGARDAGVGTAVASQAARDVLAERQRQISAEGWTPEHDDEHGNFEMAYAAACYAMADDWPEEGTPEHWPWAPHWWKPKSARQNLVRAGALILAEIERRDRAILAKVQAAKEGNRG